MKNLEMYDRDIAQVLSKALDDIDREVSRLIAKEGIGARVREAQLRESRKIISRKIDEIYKSNFALIQGYRERVAGVASLIGSKRDKSVLDMLDLSEKQQEELSDAAAVMAMRNIDAVVKRQTQTKKLIKTLDKSKKYAQGMVDRRINSGLAKGDGALEIARDIRPMFDPKTPGGVTYAAKRVGRTEIVNAFHAQAKEDFIGKPWIESVSWNLSKSHPSGSGCRCEYYAMKKTFPPEQVPDKPHPQCLCFITPNVKSVDEVLADVDDSRYDRWLEEHI